MPEKKYITIIDGWDREIIIPKVRLEEYKQMMAGYIEKAKRLGVSQEGLRSFEIKETREWLPKNKKKALKLQL